MAFADETTVMVRAGKGGDGAVAFRREPYTPRGGPSGGDGGRGGDVVLEVSSAVRDLSWLADHPHQRAKGGQSGGPNKRKGAAAEDLVVQVPNGTVVLDERGLVADLVDEGARVVVARGGRGGRGNASLAGPRDRAPRTAEAGEPGEEHRLELQLRLVADVGLVGLPNAGKSTLLSKLTAARPKVADYPFTTLTPNLGVAGDAERIVVADVPGLIEGAHEGKGLGHRFLRHVTRCRVLAVVIDASSDDALQDLHTVRGELRAFEEDLARRTAVILATKADLIDPARRRDLETRLSAEGEAMLVSGATGEGVDRLAVRLEDLVTESQQRDEPRKPYVVLRPGRERFVVRKEGERFRVVGRDVERWVTETDFDDARSVAALQKRLAKEGVERQLAATGARRGDEVVIGDRAFEFYPEQE